MITRGGKLRSVVNEEPNIPKGEHAWVGYYNSVGSLLFIITSKNNNRDLYYIKKNKNGSFVKLGKGNDPLSLCNKFDVYNRIHE